VSESDDSKHLRIEEMVFLFVKDHQGLTRQQIQKGLGTFNPDVIRIALHHLKSRALIEGYFEQDGNARMLEHFRPARLTG